MAPHSSSPPCETDRPRRGNSCEFRYWTPTKVRPECSSRIPSSRRQIPVYPIQCGCSSSHRTAGFTNQYPLEDRDASHTYTMTYEPATSIAKGYFDGDPVLSAVYRGHSDYTKADKPSFEFGASGSDASFELVRFETFQ